MQHTNQVFGIACITIGMLAMSVMDAVIKWLSGGYPLHEIVLGRSLIALFLTLFIVHFEGGFKLLKTSRPGMHIFRGFMVAIANMAFYLSLSVMPIAEATGLFFVAPLLITALSGPMLGEPVGWRRWLGVGVGFIGVILVSGMGTDAFQPAAFLSLVAALAYSLTQITTRKLGATDKASVMSFYIGAVFVVISIGFGLTVGDGHLLAAGGHNLEFLLRAWIWPDQSGYILIGVSGLLLTAVGYFVSQAYRVGSANVIAPFEYIALPLAVLWGYLFWNELPNMRALLGILLIAFSGVFIFIRERRALAQTHGNASTI